MTNNEPDVSTKIVQNGKETTADTAPETSWVPKNPPPAACWTSGFTCSHTSGRRVRPKQQAIRTRQTNTETKSYLPRCGFVA